MKPIDQWTVVELHQELKSRGVSVGGLKADLYERLRWELEAAEEPSPAASSPDNGAATGCTVLGNAEANSTSRCFQNTTTSSQAAAAAAGEEEEEEAKRGGADIQLGAGREDSGGEEWENGDEGPDFKFKLEEQEGDGFDDNPQDGLLGERSPSSCAGDEPDLVEEDEGDDLLVNEDLEEPRCAAVDVTHLRRGEESLPKGEQAGRHEEASRAGGQRTAECREFVIPKEWLPMPLIRVKNVSEDTDLEALKEVLCEGCDGMEIWCVHIDHSLDPGPSSALVRIRLPHLPWFLDRKSPAEPNMAMACAESRDCSSMPMKCNGEGDLSNPGILRPGLSRKLDAGNAAADEPGSILEAAGDLGDVKRVAEFCVRRLQLAGSRLGDSMLEFEAPILRTTLFVHNLRDEYKNDDASFKSDLEQHGELVRCFCVRNKDGSSKDYGFVEFAVPSSAAHAKVAIDSKSSEALQRFRDAKMNAMQGDHGNILPEKRLRCEWSFNQTIPSLFSKICYVSNLPVGFLDRDALRIVFEPYGEIVSCNIRSRTGMGPGCGFVEFAHGRDAENAMIAMNGRHVEKLGYILVSLVNPAKFPGDTAGAAFQRVGALTKRQRSDFAPMRDRGFPRPFMMDPRGRSMPRGRGRGRGGPMQPQYAYNEYPLYGGYHSQGGYEPGYYGNGFSFGQHHGGGYGSNYCPPHGDYPEPYNISDRSPNNRSGYKNSQFGHDDWGPMEGTKPDRGSYSREYGHRGDHGYGHQPGYPPAYTSYQSGGYGSPGYGPPGYGPSQQSHSHEQYSRGNASYQSGYEGYHRQNSGYGGQPGYGGQSGESFYGSQEHGSGYRPSGFGHNGYNSAGDRRGSDYNLGDFVGEMGRDHKRPRY